MCRPKNEAWRLGMTGDVLDAVKLRRMIMQPLGEIPWEAHVRRIQSGEIHADLLRASARGEVVKVDRKGRRRFQIDALFQFFPGEHGLVPACFPCVDEIAVYLAK